VYDSLKILDPGMIHPELVGQNIRLADFVSPGEDASLGCQSHAGVENEIWAEIQDTGPGEEALEEGSSPRPENPGREAQLRFRVLWVQEASRHVFEDAVGSGLDPGEEHAKDEGLFRHQDGLLLSHGLRCSLLSDEWGPWPDAEVLDGVVTLDCWGRVQ